MEDKKINILSVFINLILLICTLIALMYTFKQTEIAKRQTEIMTQQTNIAKYNLQSAQKSYELAEKSYRDSLNKESYDNSFAIVVDNEMHKDIYSSLYNGKLINIRFYNKSSRVQSYLVTVAAEGVMVSQDLKYMYESIPLSELPIALGVNEAYSAQFKVFIPNKIKKDAKLIIRANNRIIREATYRYDSSTKNYNVVK